MSHELRTPLNAILVNVQVLQEQIYGAINAKQLQSLTTVEKSGEHLLALINEILDLAKIESGQMVLQPTSISLAVLCESSLAFVRQQAFKKHLQIVTQIPSSCPPFWGDERRLRQALINLLINAVKFTPAGGQITLSVSWQKNVDNSPWLRIAITDTGIGIAPEDQNKLFQPFRQIDSALNRKYEGTGLGLVLVSRIVALHGGRVEVTSEVGKGSCFALLLPWDLQEWPEPTSKGPHTAMNSLAAEPHLPLILMINADLASVGSLTNYLEAKHYQLRTVADWDEAIAVLAEVRPALILVNLQSSQNQQAEGVQRLRQLPQGSRIPVLALIAADGDRQRYLTWGIDECLSRPFKLIELTTLIEENLNRSA
jgi:CheY-like chemotaxis protein